MSEPNTYLTVGNARSSGYQRSDLDWYCEPDWAVHALLKVERFRGYTHDPACGGGNIPQCFISNDLECGGSDIVDRGYSESYVSDFLDPEWIEPEMPIANIVTNPPFNLAEQFARKAFEVADHKVAILQRLAWLEGGARRAFFESTPLARVHVFSRRVSMPPGGQEIAGKDGAIAFAWFVWDHDHKGAPTIGWIP